MDKFNKKNNTVLTILSLVTLIMATLGATFAYFSATSVTKNQNITTGILKISSVSSSISQTNIVPVSENSIKKIEDKINNDNVIKMPINVKTYDTDVDAIFDIYLTAVGLEDREYINGDPTDIKWELLDENKNLIGNGTFEKSVSNLKLNKSSININKNIDSYNYTLLIYILDNNSIQNDLQNLTLSATIRVEAKQK